MSNSHEAQLALLNICRNNQAMYMKNQWQVAYYTFLLYGAIIFTQNLTGGIWGYYGLSILLCGFSIFVIVKLNQSIKEHQSIAEKLYTVLPNIRGIIPINNKESVYSITVVLIICIIMAAFCSVFIISQNVKNKDILNMKISHLDQKLDFIIGGIKENERSLKDLEKNNNVERELEVVRKDHLKRLDLLEYKVDEIIRVKIQADQKHMK